MTQGDIVWKRTSTSLCYISLFSGCWSDLSEPLRNVFFCIFVRFRSFLKPPGTSMSTSPFNNGPPEHQKCLQQTDRPTDSLRRLAIFRSEKYYFWNSPYWFPKMFIVWILELSMLYTWFFLSNFEHFGILADVRYQVMPLNQEEGWHCNNFVSADVKTLRADKSSLWNDFFSSQYTKTQN